LLAAARKEASAGSAFGVTVLGDGGAALRLLVAKTAKEASRHNCKLRPDTITAAVLSALGDGKSGPLHVVVHPGEAGWDLAVAAAVAKATNPRFSAKAGKANTAFATPSAPQHTCFVAKATTPAESLNAVAKYIQLCMRLVDAPTNLLDTTSYAEIAHKLAAKLADRGVTASEIRGEELRERGYGGLYGVGKAAEFPPALVELKYAGNKKAADAHPQQPKKVALVGKGIVYDTGGLSLKSPGTNMCGMKCDMGGSAAILAGFLLAVELGAAPALTCVLCLADNAMGPLSQRNDDIVIMKCGRTVEINNTDAEGRLVLGDGVYHAVGMDDEASHPEMVIDMATLTGAQGIATGTKHAGVLCNTDEAEALVQAAGKKCGDTTFPLLFAPEYHTPEFSSKVADCRNSVRNRSNAQSSCAGQFIADCLPKNYKGAFVHVDLASPAFQGEIATGYGVALLAQIVVPHAFAA